MRTRVEYWEKWGGVEREAMRKIVADFNESQSSYEVVMTDAGDWSSSPDLPRFLAAQTGGTPPDIIGLEDHQIADLAAGGFIVPLPLDSADLDDFRPGFLSLGAIQNRLYGVPISVDPVTLYINLSAVRGTVFEGGRIPATLREFLDALDDYDVAHPGMGLVPSYPGWWPHAWASFFGGSWVDEAGRFTPEHPGNREAMKWVRSLRRRLAGRCESAPPGCSVESDSPIEPGRREPIAGNPSTASICGLLRSAVNPIGRAEPDPFLSGQVAMVFEGDWIVRKLATVPDLEWMPAPFPCVDGVPATLVVADLLAIPGGAKNPSGASAFISFAASKDQAERLALGQSKISPLKDWSQDFTDRHPNPRIRELRSIMDSSRVIHDPRIPGWLTYLDRIKAEFEGVWTLNRDRCPGGTI